MTGRNKARRGVILLLVLSLLVLFLLMGVTFLVVASQFLKGAKAQARFGLVRDDPRELLDEAFYQVVRGTSRSGSPLWGHSLLADVYGHDGFSGTLTSSGAMDVSASGNQLVDLVATVGSLRDFRGNTPPARFSTITNYYAGCLLTFTSGPASGVSARVLLYAYTDATSDGLTPDDTIAIRIMRPRPDGVTINAGALAGSTFVLNSRPFTGTGFGYNPVTGKLDRQIDIDGDSTVDTPQIALTPNYAAFASWLSAFNVDPAAGGANESYDAPDYQNMALAMVLPGATSSRQIIPSFHRPALVRYWQNFNGGSVWSGGYTSSGGGVTVSAADFRRSIVMRPLQSDHPNFTGSNPAFDPVNGPWDVDNDGDGVADSVWLDLGLPVRTTPDGRQVKPLFAILCEDLDGRLNVNAHGSRWHYDPTVLAVTDVTLARGVSSAAVPAGEGYGPAEINLGALLTAPGEYQALVEARYGSDALPGASGLDTFAQVKFADHPTSYFNSSAAASSFFSPDNLRGRFAFGLDARGVLTYARPTNTGVDLRADSPYELNLALEQPRGPGLTAAVDQPFTPHELERILRPYDLDAPMLQSRLWQLSPTLRSDPSARRLVTTDSWDLPVPGVLAPPDYRTGSPPPVPLPRNIVELLRARLAAGGVANPDAEILGKRLLPPDLLAGLRFDINRPFGNGRDGADPTAPSGNGVVDEHWYGNNPALSESLLDEKTIGPSGLVPFDHDGDGTVGTGDSDAYLARHLLARQLYVLMMTLKDANYNIDFDLDPTTPPAQAAEETARGIAQWAINVVDFRDADSIMTPFEYDVNPFDGWSVDGFPTDRGNDGVDNDGDGNTDEADEQEPDRRVVWGCERPELLISSLLAWHDRRTEDLDTPDKKTDDPTDPDEDFDQRLLPRGAFFCELYNPWAGDERHPAELYDPADSGVQLNKVNASGTPVWRLMIVKGAGKDKDPDDPDPAKRPTAGEVERLVYFVDPSAATPPITDPGVPFFPDGSIQPNLAPLPPGRYAVVGSSGVTDGSGNYISKAGRRRDAVEGTDLKNELTRQVVLSPNSNPAVNQVQVRNNTDPVPSTAPNPSTDPAPPVPAIAVPVNAPRSLTISEPVGGYDLTGFDPSLADGEGAYTSPRDEPLDLGEPALMINGTTPDYRMVHLQRLANPLAPWDPVTNPYLTIDSSSVDITAFNGVTADQEKVGGVNIPTSTIHFETVERGSWEDTTDPDKFHLRRLWQRRPYPNAIAPPNTPDENSAVGSTVHYFDRVLQHSLGLLNRKYQPFYGNGFPNSDAGVGSPFPWLTWNNRPFVSPAELMLVPRSRSSKLTFDYGLGPGAGDSTQIGPDGPSDTYALNYAAFGHLLNFYKTTDSSGGNSGPFPNLFYLFEYLQVPSRFVGTDTLLNANAFTAPLYAYPPFNNRISNYREPGKVNINTIYDARVWNAILNGHPGPTFAQLVDSRRGYGAAGAGILAADASQPTYFANPFRPPGSGQLVPLPELERVDVEATLLRSDRIASGNNAAPNPQPLFEVLPTDAHNDSRRNPYFRDQLLQRLGNLVTTRSNVYAIWITVGFFEVDPTTGQLGQEYGLDTGQVRRHRAFYIFDRSIPVAFEPGVNHNVDRAVLVRRFIE